MSPKVRKQNTHEYEYDSYVHQIELRERPVDYPTWVNNYMVLNKPATVVIARGFATHEKVIMPITQRTCTLVWSGNRFIEEHEIPNWWVV